MLLAAIFTLGAVTPNYTTISNKEITDRHLSACQRDQQYCLPTNCVSNLPIGGHWKVTESSDYRWLLHCTLHPPGTGLSGRSFHKQVMDNPFDLLDKRLRVLEALLVELVACFREKAPFPQPEIGGIDLAQEITRLSKSRLYALVAARRIPHAKRGNKLYFNRIELHAWISAGSRSASVRSAGRSEPSPPPRGNA